MIRHRSGPTNRAESSSDDEDAFTTLARKKQKHVAAAPAPSQIQTVATATSIGSADQDNAASDAAAPKRHVVAHDDRAAKMEALLLELHREQQKVDVKQHERQRRDGGRNPRYAPPSLEKKGSYVPPEEEDTTTNIFVGNLPPTVTEERFGNIFRQFGENAPFGNPM
jgi:hypothetical protein